MTAWLKLVPSWAWWVLALAVVAGGQQVRVLSAQSVAAEAQTELANYRAEISERDRLAAVAAFQESQRRQRVIEEVRDEARGMVERASADARVADERADGLQREVARLRAGRGATCSAIASQRGEAADDALGMLADVLIEMERAGRELAAEADRRGVAGRACERAYEGLRGE